MTGRPRKRFHRRPLVRRNTFACIREYARATGPVRVDIRCVALPVKLAIAASYIDHDVGGRGSVGSARVVTEERIF